ncbi:histidine kinase [Pseudocitrobacter sp. RIT415]|uniref:histidine kinase n=1 Tax=Pseudocitrobacter TaxID=1504576 RepID=UPI000D3AF048|nr:MULTISPECIES: histidine kinase [Pseudocitrobacter]RAU52884.1 histidine kinase [Pseudocitrobacter sp. RIT 415]UYW74218.1 histidine kinase [Pseudocitrobacter faecalis]GHD89698.1 histidine kinase [Pseudocitrobacter faecalis]
MEWLVVDILKTEKTDIFSVITQCGKIKTITKIKSAFSINKGDVLTPTLNATYYINNNKDRTIVILSSVCFSSEAWAALKLS